MDDERLTPPKIYIAHTRTTRGRGVFAAEPIANGQLIETCPVLVLDEEYDDLPIELQRRVFNWNVLAGSDYELALAFGYGSMYNHDDPSNCTYTGRGNVLVITAACDVPTGAELTINYNAKHGGRSWHDDNWFARTGVSPLQ